MRRCVSSSASAAASALNPTVSWSSMLERNPLDLPRLPIPELADTIARYKESVRPFASDDEFLSACRAADAFLRERGPVLQKELCEREALAQKMGRYPCSYIEEAWDRMYLEGRWSLPINSNPQLALKPFPPESGWDSLSKDPQISAAALFSHSYLKHALSITSGRFRGGNPPVCLYQQALMFSSGRVPGKGRDRVTTTDEADHIVVISNGRFYKVRVRDRANALLTAQGLAAALELVKSQSSASPPSAPYVGHLTSANRDEWADARSKLEQKGKVNWKSLHAIDSALLVVVLDGSPVTSSLSEESALFLHGGGHGSRWFDKHNLCVLRNGALSMNFEHSFSDGGTWCRGLGEAWCDAAGVTCDGVQPLGPIDTHSTTMPPEELKFQVPDDVAAACHRASEDIRGQVGACKVNVLDFRDFGRTQMKAMGAPPDAMVQMSLQLAYRRMHGSLPSVYESCSTSKFYHGRTETIRSATASSMDFISGASQGTAGADIRGKLKAAMGGHRELSQAAQAAQGIDRHMLALRTISERQQGQSDPFFDHELSQRSSTWTLSTSTLNMRPYLSHFSFGAVVAHGYGVGYLLQEDHLPLTISSFAGGESDADVFAEEIGRALRDIQAILGSS